MARSINPIITSVITFILARRMCQDYIQESCCVRVLSPAVDVTMKVNVIEKGLGKDVKREYRQSTARVLIS
jgi:hypothetical protein